MKPKISIIIPTYNRAHLLWRAIDSVLAQSYTDCEIIVMDDGSTDNTSYMVSDKRIRYIKQDHLGAPAARNRGIREARGEFIAFLDSDDWFLPGKLEKQVSVMIANPQAALSHTSYIRCTGKEIKLINSGLFTGMVYPRLLFRCPIAMPTVMVRAAHLNGHSFREDIDCGEDLILWAQLARTRPIIGISESLTCISTNPSTNAYNPQRQLTSIRNIITYGIKQDSNLTPAMRLVLLVYWKVVKVLYWKALKFPKVNKKERR